MRTGLRTGHNVDAVDVAAGLRELTACGYDEAETRMVIDASFHGITFTCWRRVLASAVAAASA